jgi:hypothetical protein
MAEWGAIYEKGKAYEINFCSAKYEEAKAVEKVCDAIMDKKVGTPDDVQIVRHGKWIKCIHPTYKAHTVKCSCCGGYALHDSDGYWVESNYCPHCNANMDGD